MLIVVCGMHRSGSTLVWQIARRLLDGRPGLRNPRGIPQAEFPAAAVRADDLLMAKAHFRSRINPTHFPDVGARYLYTYRDVRDVVASLYRKGCYPLDHERRGVEGSRVLARTELRGDAFWRTKPDVWIGRYEAFHGDVPALVRRLAAYLHVAIDDARLAAIVRHVAIAAQVDRAREAEERGIDDDLRVTTNHITDGREGAWRDTLTPAELESIEGVAASWLVEHGYAPAAIAGATP